MNIILLVILHLILHTTPAERTDIALSILREAYPEWRQEYRYGEFDCSEMSSFVRDYLQAWGVDAQLRRGMDLRRGTRHSWVEVDGMAVEATTLQVRSGRWYDRYNVRFMGDGREDELDWWNVEYVMGDYAEK